MIGRLPLSEKAKKDYQYKDEKGFYGRGRLREPIRGRFNYDVITPSGKIVKGPWLVSENEFKELEKKNLIHWPDKDDGSPRRKMYLKDMEDKGQIPNDFWGIEYGTNQRGSIEVQELLGKRCFDFPKPVSLIEMLIRLGSNKTSTILDFFSGSATTAHAVMKLNAEDGGNRKFIMIQLPEKTSEKSEAYKVGYESICDIGEERIHRAGNAIINEWKEKQINDGLFADDSIDKLDTGFRVFTLDSSNIKPWDNELQLSHEELMDIAVKPFKEDRGKEDILYEIMLKYGVFDEPVHEIEINSKTMYQVGRRYMVICLEDEINTSDIKKIADQKPSVVIFKESGFQNDNDKVNALHNLLSAGVEDVKCI